MSVPVAFQGEVQLLGWSESHSTGAKIVLQLADADDLEAFKLMTVAKGKVAGQRLAIVAVEIGDDEQPKAQPEPKGGELAKLAGMFCQSTAFWEFCRADDADEARDWILGVCGIQSRRDLDHNPTAAQLFHDRVRKPYMESRK
ncbi:Uncharacterised protein [Achromobacter xylosoxidans]|uniref:hypothetical protein n=1 Tax=Alcaligenes xylosoxydans xylosoxydans TaxID=85698 RepID=UPI0006C50295|nr:hypothetical protein [Achromobacter xylosoxidans]CUJ41801.1 Uncharacterised protein [Achromobacter xylosoxidans]